MTGGDAASHFTSADARGEVRVGVLVDRRHRIGALVALRAPDAFAVGRPGFAPLHRMLLETALVEVRATGRAAIEELLVATSGGRAVHERLAGERRELGDLAVCAVGRLAPETGVVAGYEHHDRRRGALVALSSGAPTELVRSAAQELAKHVAFHAPRGESDDAGLDRPWFRDESMPAGEALRRLLGAEPRVEAAFAVRV